MFLKFSARRSSARNQIPATSTTLGTPSNKIRNDNSDANVTSSGTLDSNPHTRRSRTARACDNCRKHRIKCGEQRPCQYCSRTGKSCITTPQLHSRSSSRPNIMKDDGYRWLEQDIVMPDNSSGDGVVIPPSPFLAASQWSSSNQHADSDISLMTRATAATPRIHDNDAAPQLAPEIQKFLHACWQSSLPTSSPTALDSPFLQLPSPELPSDECSINTSLLSERQRSYYMRCFRHDCHPLFPIIGEKALAEVTATSLAPIISHDSSVKGAFVDAMIALGIQHTHQTGVNQRMLGLQQQPCADSDSSSKTATAAWPGFEYFCSSRSRLRDDPHHSLESLQCHVLLVLYLINGQAYRDAYNLVGITVRKAYAAKLHRVPPTHLSEPMRLERMHLWWMLFYLDSRCSLQLDMPAAIQKGLVTCPIPAVEDLARHVFTGADQLILCAYSNRLIHLANVMANTAANHSGDGNGDMSSDTLKQHVLRALSTIKTLESWHKQLAENFNLPCPFSSYFKAEILAIENEPRSLPTWLQRQKAFLELAYHNACTLSLRDFLCHPLATCKTATGDGDGESAVMLSQIRECITSAIEHSMKIIDLVFNLCSMSDVFYGWSEILQPMWNATVTLMASICIKTSLSCSGSEISNAITRAISIFNLFSMSDLAAMSAKKLLGLLASYLQTIITKECALNNSTGVTWDNFFLPLEKQDSRVMEENILFFNL
ncbi:uncharacterized protein TrAtP1_010615 [Trichoderma atroviride]|uniref:uncharacterized protein n=1 Tax=Hypocrea atroviridis TaxID=63577 RepID=UPI003333F145|nr:hypothetical protein TrAtP1_010615 [Trichoderma atroviride]